MLSPEIAGRHKAYEKEELINEYIYLLVLIIIVIIILQCPRVIKSVLRHLLESLTRQIRLSHSSLYLERALFAGGSRVSVYTANVLRFYKTCCRGFVRKWLAAWNLKDILI